MNRAVVGASAAYRSTVRGDTDKDPTGNRQPPGNGGQQARMRVSDGRKTTKNNLFSEDNFVSSTKTSNFAAAKGKGTCPCPCANVIGIWCNWQHNRFWSCYFGFESRYPNKETPTVQLAFFVAPTSCPNKNYSYICTRLEDL